MKTPKTLKSLHFIQPERTAELALGETIEPDHLSICMSRDETTFIGMHLDREQLSMLARQIVTALARSDVGTALKLNLEEN